MVCVPEKTIMSCLLWDNQITQWVKVPVAKTDNVTLISGAKMIEREKLFLQVSSDLYTYTQACKHTHTHTHTVYSTYTLNN